MNILQYVDLIQKRWEIWVKTQIRCKTIKHFSTRVKKNMELEEYHVPPIPGTTFLYLEPCSYLDLYSYTWNLVPILGTIYFNTWKPVLVSMEPCFCTWNYVPLPRTICYYACSCNHVLYLEQF